MGVGNGRQEGAVAPWIFIHGTDIVDRGLIVLFSVFFCYFSVFFPLSSSHPPGNFSANALELMLCLQWLDGTLGLGETTLDTETQQSSQLVAIALHCTFRVCSFTKKKKDLV